MKDYYSDCKLPISVLKIILLNKELGGGGVILGLFLPHWLIGAYEDSTVSVLVTQVLALNSSSYILPSLVFFFFKSLTSPFTACIIFQDFSVLDFFPATHVLLGK